MNSRPNSPCALTPDAREALAGACASGEATPPCTPLLQVRNVSVGFGGRPVLRDVSLDLADGQVVGIVGASGGGKTTLFNVIAGLLQPDEGQVLLDGRDITGKPGSVAYMMQKDLLLPNRRIADNVALPARLAGVPKAESRRRAEQLLPDFGLAEAGQLWPSQLSGGMRQRAALARTYLLATLRGNGVALLDEPFSALDALTKAEMHRWYLDVMARIHLSTLFVTHDIDEAILLSDRVLVLKGGTVADAVDIAHPGGKTADFALTESFLVSKRRLVGLLG